MIVPGKKQTNKKKKHRFYDTVRTAWNQRTSVFYSVIPSFNSEWEEIWSSEGKTKSKDRSLFPEVKLHTKQMNIDRARGKYRSGVSLRATERDLPQVVEQQPVTGLRNKLLASIYECLPKSVVTFWQSAIYIIKEVIYAGAIYR